MTSVQGEGTRAATVRRRADADAAFRGDLVEALADNDDSLLAAYLDDERSISSRRLRDALAAQTRQALVHPVFCGSAITGAGVDGLTAGLVELLPTSAVDGSGPVSGVVFKIDRGPTGEKIAYVRMFSGTVRTRDRLRFGGDREGKVTAVSVFEPAGAGSRTSASAGQIAKLWGLGEIRIGDRIGERPGHEAVREFAPPTLESVVEPFDGDQRQQLRVALAQLAEQDPLIAVRQDDARQELSISLYGEVQQEVIQATLANDFGVAVTFRDTTPIYVERPLGAGAALESLHAPSNPFLATIGLRVEPAREGSGIDFRLDVDHRGIPLYLYKTSGSFAESMSEYVRRTLQEGLYGWEVTDCAVTMTECSYSVPDGPPSRRGPLSTAADFRKLTPLVLMQALARAGVVVCEPTVRASVEVPADTVGAVAAAVTRLGGAVDTLSPPGELSTVTAILPAVRASDLQRQLPGLTRGEGVIDASFAGYQPVRGEPPTRRRTMPNPLKLDEYLLHLAGYGGRRAAVGDG